MNTRTAVLVLGVALCLAVGCAQVRRFQDPSKEECEAAFEHVLSVLAKGSSDDALVREAGVAIADWLTKKSGTKERLVKQCLVKASRADTDCILAAKTSESLDQCEFMKTWE